MINNVIIRSLGMQEYAACFQAMKNFTIARNAETMDEIWLVEHPPIFTQGQNGKSEHILNPGSIPVLKVDRGGQVTYHGPGQLLVYILVDIKRKNLTIRELVTLLEKSIIAFLIFFNIPAYAKREAPGIYIDEKKICSIGLRIKKGCSYHGLALNVNLDLEPFTRINPCGYPTLKMTKLSTLGHTADVTTTGIQFTPYLTALLGYNNLIFANGKTP